MYNNEKTTAVLINMHEINKNQRKFVCYNKRFREARFRERMRNRKILNTVKKQEVKLAQKAFAVMTLQNM